MMPLVLPIPLLLPFLAFLSQAQPHRILPITGGDVCFRLQLTSAPSSHHCALVERWDGNNAPSAVKTIGQPRLHVEHDSTPTAAPPAAPTAAPMASFVSTACCVAPRQHRPTVLTVVLIVDDAQQGATGIILATATVLVLHGSRAALPPSAKLNLGAGSDLIHASSSGGDDGSAWLNFDGLFYSNDADASNQGRDDWATDAASTRAAAASRSPNLVVRWEWHDGLAFLPDASVRIITVSHALMYAGFNERRQWEDFFRECRRILEPFGVIRMTGDDHRRQVL